MAANHPWPWSFGQTLRLVRVSRGLTMVEAAELAGHDQGYLSRVESDKADPSARFLGDMAKAYGCPWWSHARNVNWIHEVAWVYGNHRVVSPSSSNRVRHAIDGMALALSITNDLETVVKQANSIGIQYTRLLERLGLGNAMQIAMREHTPLWHWIVESLGLAKWADSGKALVEQMGDLLTLCERLIGKYAIGVNPQRIGQAVRELREQRNWSTEVLAEKVNTQLVELLWMKEEPIVALRKLDAADVRRLETGQVHQADLLYYAAISEALDVPMSHIIDSGEQEVPKQRASLSEVVDVLNRYGLDSSAIAIIQALMPYLTRRPDGSNGPT